MESTRVPVIFTVGLIGILTLVSGPLVPGIDLTAARTDAPTLIGNETDSISAAVVSAPDTDIRFEKAQFGAGTYELVVPDAVIRIEAVSGRPRVIYRLNIPAMHYSRGTIHFVDAAQANSRLTLNFESTDFTPDELSQERYAGRLAIVTLDSTGSTEIYNESVTIRVE